MKKIFILATLLFAAVVGAQEVSVTAQGAPIEDGYTFTTSSLAGINEVSQPNKLRFRVTNLTDAGMYVGVKLVSLSSNAPAEGTQLCFGSLCVPNVTAGLLVPFYDEVPAGETTPGTDDHFINTEAGTDGAAVTYNLAIVRLTYNEEDGEYTEAETLLSFSYVYQPTAGVTDFSGLAKMGLTVEGTVIKNSLNISATQNASLQLFDVNGKQVKTVAVKSGSQAVDFSALASGVYMAKFTTEANRTATIKLVKN